MAASGGSGTAPSARHWTVYDALRGPAAASASSFTTPSQRHSDGGGVGVHSVHGYESYAAFHARVLETAEWVRADLVARPSDRLAILISGHDEHLFWLFVAACADMVLVPLNTRWGVREIADAVADTTPRLLVAGERYVETATRALKQAGADVAVLPAELLRREPAQARQVMRSRRGWRADESDGGSGVLETACGIFFTSGTTGRSKGAVLTHVNLLVQGYAKITQLQYSTGSVCLHLVPMFHVGGCSSAVAITMAGGSHVVGEPGSFSPEAALMLIRRHGVTTFSAVPTMLQMLCETFFEKRGKATPCTSVTSILVGGGALDEALARRTVQVFPSTRLFVAYGMTEAASSMTFADRTPSSTAAAPSGGAGGNVGHPPPHVTLAVVDTLKRPVEAGTVGEVITRGPHVMRAYYNRPQETAAALRNGWLHTGDLGYLEADGSLVLKGREKDMIKTGGENVYAREVEEVLLRHPRVRSCAVVGVPDLKYGEAIWAAIVPYGGWTSLPLPDLRRELTELCRAELSPYKIPRRFILLTELPTNSSGKVVKHEVRGMLIANY